MQLRWTVNPSTTQLIRFAHCRSRTKLCDGHVRAIWELFNFIKSRHIELILVAIFPPCDCRNCFFKVSYVERLIVFSWKKNWKKEFIYGHLIDDRYSCGGITINLHISYEFFQLLFRLLYAVFAYRLRTNFRFYIFFSVAFFCLNEWFFVGGLITTYWILIYFLLWPSYSSIS